MVVAHLAADLYSFSKLGVSPKWAYTGNSSLIFYQHIYVPGVPAWYYWSRTWSWLFGSCQINRFSCCNDSINFNLKIFILIFSCFSFFVHGAVTQQYAQSNIDIRWSPSRGCQWHISLFVASIQNYHGTLQRSVLINQPITRHRLFQCSLEDSFSYTDWFCSINADYLSIANLFRLFTMLSVCEWLSFIFLTYFARRLAPSVSCSLTSINYWLIEMAVEIGISIGIAPSVIMDITSLWLNSIPL